MELYVRLDRTRRNLLRVRNGPLTALQKTEKNLFFVQHNGPLQMAAQSERF